MSVESWLEGNWLRPYVREQFEVKPLREATDVNVIPHALHIECKSGGPTALIMKHFSIEKMTAIDRDEVMITAARVNPELEGINFGTGDVCSLSFGDGTFDAVFDLAELHNYADWERGLAEMRRVLRPGGLLILEELSLESFRHAAGRLFRLLTEHPYDTMFTTESFRRSVLGSGFGISHFQERNQFGLLKYFTMIARRI